MLFIVVIEYALVTIVKSLRSLFISAKLVSANTQKDVATHPRWFSCYDE